MLGPGGQPLQRHYYSRKSGKELDDAELVSGYETKKGKYVTVSDEELERLAPEKSRDINLRLFVDAPAIPPLFVEDTYFLAPASQSLKAYLLLGETMERTGQAGIATFVMRGKEYLVAIFARHSILQASTLRFSDEIRSPKDVGLPEKKNADKRTVRRFTTIIQKKTRKTLSPQLLRDTQADAIERYVRKKQSRHKDLVQADLPAAPKGEVVDIMSILKKSLEGKRKRAA
jgi:DNA end-binding protein Ku